MSTGFTDSIMMIQPVRFGFNEETYSTNPYQHKNGLKPAEIQKEALKEFNDFVRILRKEKIKVEVFKDTKQPHTPDSIFPNNWVSFHQDKTVVIYPMYAKNRRKEKRKDIIEKLKSKYGIKKILDLSYYEKKGMFLEGTGSMVLDRRNKIVYACISPRTNEKMLKVFSRFMGYKIVKFGARDIKGNDLYHTNIMMAICDGFCVICKDAIKNKKEASGVLNSLKETGYKIIEITLEQCNSYAGNILQLKHKGKKIVVMSERAYSSLRKEQIAKINCRIVKVKIETIEDYGGGSARCMLAELF